MRRAVRLFRGGRNSSGSSWYQMKRTLLGPPLVNEELSQERLSNAAALGVLSPDGISSSAYGTEEILIGLLQGGLGLAAFAILLPITGVILLILAFVVLSYREVVAIYTRTGGSYVVAREAFGPRVAQIAAVALLIDYTVTVAVQVSAGAAAIVSAVPGLSTLPVVGPDILVIMSVIVILIMCYGNLRGIREAGRSFALPTYLFTAAVTVMIVAGLIREAAGTLPVLNPAALHGTFYTTRSTSLLISFALIFTLLRSFANGGSSLTGIEAVSNAVSAFRPPEGVNARRVLVTQGLILAFLICGIAWLAHVTHATPYQSGTPTVISQEASLVFGGGLGQIMYYIIQAATALILFTGGNTSFNGFPFLASFVAEDAFLPRWLTKRGHRLVFSNGIIVLTVVALALVIGGHAKVDALVPLYAIGVFTGFSMAGFGMARYHTRHKEPGWRRRRVINFSAGVLSAFVVAVSVITKFTEGAWIVVIAGPILVYVLIRLNREYRLESAVLENIGGRERVTGMPNYPRRAVVLFVDSYDLATIAALRYAKSLRPTALRAVHFVIDSVRAERLREQWLHAGTGIPLDLVECADRRLTRAAAELVTREVADPGMYVTAVLPRRSHSPLLGRLLHDRTADKMAREVSRIPRVVATIIPFDVADRVEMLAERQAAGQWQPDGQRQAGAQWQAGGQPKEPAAARGTDAEEPVVALHDRPPVAPGADPIGSLTEPGRRIVEGRVHSVEIRPAGENYLLACTVADDTGDLTALFYGRQRIPGLEPGVKVRLTGTVAIRDGAPVMTNPAYELVS